MAQVLIIDDEPLIRETMQQLLTKEGHTVAEAKDGADGLRRVQELPIDVVVSDIIMPGMNGLELLRRMQEVAPAAKVILITGEPTLETASLAVRAGAFDYLPKPVNRRLLCDTVARAVRFKQLEDENRRHRDGLEQLVLARTEKLRLALEQMVDALGCVMETRDPYTAGHQRRVAELAGAIAAALHLPEPQQVGLRLAALLHDIGKLRVPAEILTKPTKLTPAEFQIVTCHPEAGYEIIRHIDFPWPLAEIVLQHHERLDGSGYPRRLQGEAILLEDRILGVADTVEAMASHRPYRPALGIDAALAEIEAQRGHLYDPPVVDACVRLFGDESFRFSAGG